MKTAILHIIQKAIILLLALQILNLSTNSIDFQPIRTSNLSEFNDLNMITEFVAEILLGHTNAFPEFAKKEEKQTQLQKHITIKLISSTDALVQVTHAPFMRLFCFSQNEKNRFQFFKEINPPPPKA